MNILKGIMLSCLIISSNMLPHSNTLKKYHKRQRKREKISICTPARIDTTIKVSGAVAIIAIKIFGIILKMILEK